MILDLFRSEVEFKNIQEYHDIKDVVRRALDAEDNYNCNNYDYDRYRDFSFTS